MPTKDHEPAAAVADAEVLLTRYHIFETDEDAVTLTRIGYQDARSSDDAKRKFFQEPIEDREGVYVVAISENHCKLTKAKARVVTSLEPVEMKLLSPLAGEPLTLDGIDE